MQERLQKVLAAAGVASRRDAEALITGGKVTVNGEVVTELGRKVDPTRDHIAVEGRRIAQDVQHIYVLLNKPQGYVTTREDPHATHTVMDLIRPPLEGRLGRGNPAVEGLHPVGRIDAQTEGLLILTNDGAFTQHVTHPRHQIPKLYVAEVRGIPDREALDRLRTGVPLFGHRTLPARVRLARVDRSRQTAIVEVELREGRNQQVRRMLQAVGYPVNSLRRTAIGPVTIGRMKPGQWRFLTEAEVEGVLKSAGPAEAGAEASEAPASAPRSRPRPARGGKAPGGARSKPSGTGTGRAPRQAGKTGAGRGSTTASGPPPPPQPRKVEEPGPGGRARRPAPAPKGYPAPGPAQRPKGRRRPGPPPAPKRPRDGR
jgi:23S rRNA pseudouridine2605 synthase